MRKAIVGRSPGGAFTLGLSKSLVGISTSTEPTLYGPVCAGKAGVGFSRLSQVIFAVVSGLVVAVGRREGRPRVRDLIVRKNDSVIEETSTNDGSMVDMQNKWTVRMKCRSNAMKVCNRMGMETGWESGHTRAYIDHGRHASDANAHANTQRYCQGHPRKHATSEVGQ